MNIKSLGTSIKQYRKQFNITQEKLSEMLGVSTHYLYELERGIKVPSLTVLINIAELFNTSIDNLLSEDEPVNNNYDELDMLVKSLSPSKRREDTTSSAFCSHVSNNSAVLQFSSPYVHTTRESYSSLSLSNVATSSRNISSTLCIRIFFIF